MVRHSILAIAALTIIGFSGVSAQVICPKNVSEETCAVRIREAMKAWGSGTTHAALIGANEANKPPRQGCTKVDTKSLGNGYATTRWKCPKF